MKMSVSKIKAYFIFASCLVFLISCSEKDTDKVFAEFPVSLELEGDVIEFPDSFINAIGSVRAVDDGYWCSIYDSEDCLLVTDSMFMPIRTFARKGEGPGEISGKSAGFGNPGFKDDLRVVYDPYEYKLYGTNSNLDYELRQLVDFSADSLKRYVPSRVLPIGNDRYVFVKGDFSYGLVEYDSKDSSVKEWPLGYDFENPENPDMKITDLRVVKHNPNRNVVAEIYDRLPTVIIHDETGEVRNRFTYGGYNYPEIDDETPHCFGDVSLTDKYIWLLYCGPQDESGKISLFVIDYDGNPVARLLLPKGANGFYVDEGRNRIIGVDPNSEDKNIVIYDIPEILR